MADNDDYRSSDDEDYVPEAGVDDIEDEPSGDEVDEVAAESGALLTGRRRGKVSKTKSSSRTAETLAVSSSVDTDALFAAMLEDEDPLLAGLQSSSSVAVDGSSSTTVSSGSLTDADTSSSAEAGTSSSVSQPTVLQDGSEKTMITEVFDFAGDEVKVQREVTVSELREREQKEKTKDEQASKKQPQKRIGLCGALTMLSKKPKMSVLDKSNHDWTSFKQENKLEEELETFNKGKNGYLNKMDFLTRTDHREFENEKAMRNATRKPQ